MSLRPSAKTEIRRSRYKVAVDTEEGRRRREDYLVEIRKNKREESLMKKRRDGAKDLPPDSDNPFENLLEISNMIAGVFSNNPSLQLESTTRFRMILSLNRNPPIDNVIQFGVVPRFVEFLKKDDHPKLQFEAAWALTNIACGTSEQTKVVIDHEAVPIFVQLLASPSDDVREQAIWALGNVAGDSIQSRDFVLNCGALMPLVHQLNEYATLEMPLGLYQTSSVASLLRPLTRFSHEVSAAMSLIDGLFSDDPSRQLESATNINMILSMSPSGNRTLGTEYLIRSSIVARFVHFLGNEDFPKLQYEAACALKNIAAIHPDLVVIYNAVPILVKLIASSRYYVREAAIGALGNVASHSVHRDYVLQCGALMPVLSQLHKDTNLSMLRSATRTLSNLCCGMPPPTFDEVKYALEPHLYSNDEEILRYVCVAIQYLCDGSEDAIQSVIEFGFVPKLVKVLRHPSPSVLTPVLDTIKTIVSTYNHQTQCVINCGALPILANLFSRDYEKRIKVKTFTTISSITAGFRKHIQSVIDANLIPRFVNLAQNTELDMKKLAVWAISNVTSRGSHDQIKYLVEQGCIKPLCDRLVTCPYLEIISLCLDGLENILKVGEAEKNIGDLNYYSQLIEDAEGLEKIENLQHHESNEIYEKALKILETYWVEEDDEHTQQPSS